MEIISVTVAVNVHEGQIISVHRSVIVHENITDVYWISWIINYKSYIENNRVGLNKLQY